MRTKLAHRHLCFLFLILGSLVVLWSPVRDLLGFSLAHDYASHIILVAPGAAYLIYRKRHEAFLNVRTSLFGGVIFLLAGVIVGFAAHIYLSTADGKLSLQILSLFMFWTSAFLTTYGVPAAVTVRFPLLLLLLAVPIPEYLIGRIILFLQSGSAEVAYLLLRIASVPVLKDGLTLRLPGLNLAVARECSGIRSSVSLLITTLLLGEFLLKSAWRKSLLVLTLVPLVILKNGARIATISMLTLYVDRGFLNGWLHHSGGIVFYVLGLLGLIPIIILLRSWERRSVVEFVAAGIY